MVLREKQKPRGWRAFTAGSRGDEPILSPRRRGALYVSVLIFTLWFLLGRRSESHSSATLSNTLRSQALRLTNSVPDEDIYGPPIVPLQQRPLHPGKSAIAPLRSWESGVPETTVHGISGGWSVMDNVVLMNGTLFIVSNDPSKFPPLTKMFSTGVPMESEPSTWRGRDTTDREMQIVSTEQAHALFGNHASRIKGTSFLCNDAPQFTSHYYHYIGEIVFGMWRAYSMLDLNIPSSGILEPSSLLTAPRRFIFPHVPSAKFRDYSGLSEYITRAIFPSMAFEFADSWDDKNMTGRPFLLDRVVIGDRIAAELSDQWANLYKYAAPAFELPGSGTKFWAPMRRALVQFLGHDELLEDSKSPEAEKERSKTVITYISRQNWGRRMLVQGDHEKLVKALKGLESKYGYEVNVVTPDSLSKKDQLVLAARTTVMLGVHGNGLTHSLWMDPSRRPLLLEFFADKGFIFDYEYPARQLGITYYGWWNSKHFSHSQLPPHFADGDFQGNEIRIDGDAVARLIHEHVTGTLKD